MDLDGLGVKKLKMPKQFSLARLLMSYIASVFEKPLPAARSPEDAHRERLA
jgi:hypothetical protein